MKISTQECRNTTDRKRQISIIKTTIQERKITTMMDQRHNQTADQEHPNQLVVQEHPNQLVVREHLNQPAVQEHQITSNQIMKLRIIKKINLNTKNKWSNPKTTINHQFPDNHRLDSLVNKYLNFSKHNFNKKISKKKVKPNFR